MWRQLFGMLFLAFSSSCIAMEITNLSPEQLGVKGDWHTQSVWSAEEQFRYGNGVLPALDVPKYEFQLKTGHKVIIPEHDVWPPPLETTLGVLIYLHKLTFTSRVGTKFQIRNTGRKALDFTIVPPDNKAYRLNPSSSVTTAYLREIVFDDRQFKS